MSPPLEPPSKPSLGSSLLKLPQSALGPCRLLPAPCSLLPAPCSLLPAPCPKLTLGISVHRLPYLSVSSRPSYMQLTSSA